MTDKLTGDGGNVHTDFGYIEVRLAFPLNMLGFLDPLHTKCVFVSLNYCQQKGQVTKFKL